MRPPADSPSPRRKSHRGTRSLAARCRRRCRAAARDVPDPWDGDAAAANDDTEAIALPDEQGTSEACLSYNSFSCVGVNRNRAFFPSPELFPSETEVRGPENKLFFPDRGARPRDTGKNNGFRLLRTGAPPRSGVAVDPDFRPGLDPPAPDTGLRPAAVSEGSRGPPGTWDDRRVNVGFFPSEPAVSPKEHGPDLEGNSADMSVDTTFKLFHLNPRGLGGNIAEVTALVETIGSPEIVGFTETWIERGDVQLSGYHCVSQLGRRNAVRGDRGGIALYARDGFQDSVVHLADSPTDERAWYIIHADSGPVLLCLWYRPPNSGLEPVTRFDTELSEYSRHAVSCIVMGDMNVHNVEWLRHSNRTSPEGIELETVCCSHGLRQLVTKPTRGPYLLDLVLSDLASGIRCRVVKGIHSNDHDGVLTTVGLSIPASQPVQRKVYDFKKADWTHLKLLLLEADWRTALDLSGDAAAETMVQTILDKVSQCIPSRVITDKVWAHPWLNDACRKALLRKREAFGTDDFARLRDACSRTYVEAHDAYVAKTRDKLKELSPSSRGWWRLSGTLLEKAGNKETIPPLQRADETWALTPEEKAAELAHVFRSKSNLPPREDNEYTTLTHEPPAKMLRMPRLRVSTVHNLLCKLDETSGTGPDLLPARILKHCAAELAIPVTLLTRKLLREHCWPQCWRLHWIHGIHKRGPKAQGNNYRGVHLTPQLSKVVERAVGSLVLPWLECTQAYGPNQYAYAKGRGYKDVLAVNVYHWLLLMERGLAVAVYCSDVSGAFDRVSQERLGDKLETLGLHADALGFLKSWLDDRRSKVVLGGTCSLLEALTDSVFQGTVLGPPLWNTFFADSRRPLGKKGFTETTFADDLNAWKGFRLKRDAAESHKPALDELAAVQRELHLWGAANQVLFDPGKESFHILHRRMHYGEDFKVLGCVFDSQLLMHAASRHVATEAGWRLKTLLRSRRYFTTPELMRLYKAQILSFAESSTPALYHAATTTLSRIDRVQTRFLREVGLTELQALKDYRLAPLRSRRDMGMLGLLHKVNLRKAPVQLEELFPRLGTVTEPMARQRFRRWRPLHNRQLGTLANHYSTDTMQNSLFGLAHCYNTLPQRVVDSSSVKVFQKKLQEALLELAGKESPDWQELYSGVWKRFPRTNFDQLFC